MTFADQQYNLRIRINTENCRLSDVDWEVLRRDLHPLHQVIEDFPVSDLMVTINHHARSGDYHVKTSLRLPGRTLFTGDRDAHPRPAANRCARKLVHKVEAYKAGLERAPERAKQAKGTHHDVVPEREPDVRMLNAAVERGEYAQFRRAMFPYEDPVRKRAGRWVQRYPEIEEMIGRDLVVDDVVEEVFLNAYEHFPSRPKSLRLGQWLEDLIDPSVRMLLKSPDEEKRNIEMARTWMRTESEPSGPENE